MKVRSAAALAAAFVFTTSGVAAAGPPAPIDAQDWSWQDELTWADYKPLPGPDYSDLSIEPSVKRWKTALVVFDFPDREFIVSQPPGGTIWGTPTTEAHSIPRAQVPAFYRDFLNTPSALNRGQTTNRYWMEDSFGRYGVTMEAFGPYRLPGRSYQYFLSEFGGAGQAAHCPTPETTPCNLNYRTHARAAWAADVGEAKIAEYDNIFYLAAGASESSTWQEFGEMQWKTREDVPDAFGPKAFDPTKPNWALTRYVPWSSWASSANMWASAQGNNSIVSESSGMSTFAHELSHNLSLPDNYGNPYGTTQQRGFTGMWEMMSRGTFNGPGGPHTRYLVPATQGGALGAQHSVRNKRALGFLRDEEILRLNRDGLAESGIAVAEVTAREVPTSAGEVSGLHIALDGDVGDNSAPCVVAEDWRCDGVRTQGTTITGKYHNFTVEVVQQIGSDSFGPGHGVLIAKNKNSSSNCGAGTSCYAWLIDAKPEDIDQIDYVGPDGVPVKATLGDERQLNDASFNAGLNSGTEYEWVDERNRLHFYVIDKRTDADGVFHYKVAVRSLDGAGAQTRGVALGAPTVGAAEGYTTCTFDLANTGVAAASPDVHPQDASAFLGSDVYRLSVSGTGAYLKTALAAAKFGESVAVPVYLEGPGSATVTAVSESDPAKTASATCTVAEGDVGGTVPATLSLTLGTPADFGAFTPGLGKDYFASTPATVLSTAGDAALTVSDSSTVAPGHLVNGTFSLPQPLQVGTANTYAALPATIKTWAGPVSNDDVAVSFKQPVGMDDALRTGRYAKTLTFTLSTTNP